VGTLRFAHPTFLLCCVGTLRFAHPTKIHGLVGGWGFVTQHARGMIHGSRTLRVNQGKAGL